MRNANSKPQSDTFELPIDWHGSAVEIPVRHANQVMVQIHEKEVILSFFYFSPPVLMGEPEQVKTQLRSIKAIKPECLGRISLPAHTFKSLSEIMQKKVIELESEAVRGDQDE